MLLVPNKPIQEWLEVNSLTDNYEVPKPDPRDNPPNIVRGIVMRLGMLAFFCIFVLAILKGCESIK